MAFGLTGVHRQQKRQPKRQQRRRPKRKQKEAFVLPFTDVVAGDWFYNYVQDVYKLGLMTGYGEVMDDGQTTFGPADDLARAQFAVILYRMEGEPKVQYNGKFPDVPDGRMVFQSYYVGK